MRDSAHEHGWYEYRRPVQTAFIAFLGIGMLVVLLSLRVFLANSWRQNTYTWLGIVLLCVFILMRAASFHHFDILIGHPLLGLKVNFILEVGALLLIIFGTYYHPIVATNKTSNYVELAAEGDDVYCPQCNAQAVAKAAHGRHFKCKACANSYSVYIR